ncbi:hypothetical protein FOL47_002018 [Perkinsus chesapeaki]|uniref:Uncharacterized protein n=1 Tax=Perkinsus chesapeaki TaxID=330153 RepID=A0A7J6MFW7_PERCH|nr:hypothetical protein FOL47_002018 [Perkinsus chesapeaki]
MEQMLIALNAMIARAGVLVRFLRPLLKSHDGTNIDAAGSSERRSTSLVKRRVQEGGPRPMGVLDRLFTLFDASEYGSICQYDFVSTIELFWKGPVDAQLRCAFHVYRLSNSHRYVRGRSVEVVTREDLFRLIKLDAPDCVWMTGDIRGLLKIFCSRADECLERGLRYGSSVQGLWEAQTLHPRFNQNNIFLYDDEEVEKDDTRKFIDDLIQRISEEDGYNLTSGASTRSHHFS